MLLIRLYKQHNNIYKGDNMKSYQINFFMHPDDLLEFEQVLGDARQVSFIQEPLQSEIPVLVDSLINNVGGSTWLRAYVVRKPDYPKISSYFVKGQGYWLIDEKRSPVVEIMRSFFDGKIVRRGRLYYCTGYFDDKENWLEKDADFVSWGKQLTTLIRRKYTRDKETGYYIGPHAYRWKIETGGAFIST